MLRTLGYRIPARHVDALLGAVALYPWGAEFEDAWRRLPRRPVRPGKPPASPRYRQLQTGLTAVHRGPVRIMEYRHLSQADKDAGVKGMIAAAGAIDPFVLATCVDTFERCVREGAPGTTLAPLLPPADATQSFGKVITAADSGTAAAPGWVFESAVWRIMERLTSQPLRLGDGHQLVLRLDTDGAALAWDSRHLVTNTWKDYTGYAMLKVKARIITLPRISDLAIVFDAHMSRINNQWRGSKTAWIERGDPALPLLRVPVRNVPPGKESDVWTTAIANHAATIAKACGMEPLDIVQELPVVPGHVRPLVPGPRKHPVGRGPGARLMLRLAEHIQSTCGELEPLQWAPNKAARVRESTKQALGAPARTPSGASDGGRQVPKRAAVTPSEIAAVAAEAGAGRVRLLCLYSTSEARHRMTQQLRALSPLAAPARDGEVSSVNEHLAVSFHRTQTLLKHGKHDRRDDLNAIAESVSGETGPLLAWAETEYDAATGKPADDAKNPVRRRLAEFGIASQFLSTRPHDAPPLRKRKKAKASEDPGDDPTDHAANAAAADLLLRTAGVVHPRLTQGILQDFLSSNPAHASVHLVGLHFRLQQAPGDDSPARLVVTATSVLAQADSTRPWTVTMWSDKANAWIAQSRAIADFHSQPIGSAQRGRSGDKASDTRIYIESILDALAPGPVVLMVDAVAARTMYPGLQNHRFGTGPLPGLNLSQQRDVAIVRCNTSDEVPRPVDRQGGRQPADPAKPAAPDRMVYQLSETGVWLFGKSSRVYRAKGGRLGADYTPWSLPENLRHKLEDDWHSYTATEIAVPRCGPWSELALVTLVARLCDHTMNWDDRTLLPIPLHLSTRADVTHPEYRTDEEVDQV